MSWCGSVTLYWSLLFDRCGLIAMGLIAVVWSLWFGHCGLVAIV